MYSDDPVADRLSRIKAAAVSGRLRLVEAPDDRRRRIESSPYAAGQPALVEALVNRPRIPVDVALGVLEVAAEAAA